MRFAVKMGAILAIAWGTSVQAADKAPPPGSAYAMPNNIYGAHLLVDDGKPGSRGRKHLRWARHLVGRWSYAKSLFANITAETEGPADGWVDYVNACYELEMIPFMRLAGIYDGEKGYWIKPEADAPGDYSSMAAAVKRVVEGFPRSDLCPLYIEVWNEPNLSVEWTGETDAKEYADFFVQVAEAIRSIGDDRIRILNGSLALSPEWTEKLCKANPKFINSFDVWGTHPYPMNHPPHLNHHAGNVDEDLHFTIDSYVRELDVLRRLGRGDVPVMITETGWDLGNATYTRSEGHPIIDEYNRADYIMRSFRDYWPKWDEILAVFPFEFSDWGWERFDWVYPDSGINPDGSPTKPHYQYTVVAALAKPTDTTGAINGTVTVDELDVRLEGAKVTAAGQSFTTDPMGNYFLARIEPGSYEVAVSRTGFNPVERKLKVTAGENTVFDVALEATRRVDLVGRVLSGDDDRPLSGVTVKLEPGEAVAKTNADGEYRIKNCIPARYSLRANADGRYPYEVDNVVVDTGKTNRHDFRLGRRPKLPGENMANNPSMEAGGGGGGKPWIALGFEPLLIDSDLWDKPPARVVDTEAHTGRLSQAMRLFEQEVVIRQITHYGTAEPGTRYRGGMWVKTSCPPGDNGAWITFTATEANGSVIGLIGPSEKINGRSDWIWLELEGVAPPGSDRLSLNLHTQGKSGMAYFDDGYIGMVPGE